MGIVLIQPPPWKIPAPGQRPDPIGGRTPELKACHRPFQYFYCPLTPLICYFYLKRGASHGRKSNNLRQGRLTVHQSSQVGLRR